VQFETTLLVSLINNSIFSEELFRSEKSKVISTMERATPKRPRGKRCLSGLGGHSHLNVRNGMGQIGPTPVSVEAPRKKRTVRSNMEFSGRVRQRLNNCNPNDTCR
jgi:hypothetical protein